MDVLVGGKHPHMGGKPECPPKRDGNGGPFHNIRFQIHFSVNRNLDGQG